MVVDRGAYGVVKKCTHKKSQEEFAAKFIQVKNGMWDALRREVLVMGLLDHKRLIKLYNAYETKRDVIMVMELYPFVLPSGFCKCRIKARSHR